MHCWAALKKGTLFLSLLFFWEVILALHRKKVFIRVYATSRKLKIKYHIKVKKAQKIFAESSVAAENKMRAKAKVPILMHTIFTVQHGTYLLLHASWCLTQNKPIWVLQNYILECFRACWILLFKVNIVASTLLTESKFIHRGYDWQLIC